MSEETCPIHPQKDKDSTAHAQVTSCVHSPFSISHQNPNVADIAVCGLPDSLSYAIPEEMRGEIAVGWEVRVELRSRLVRGWVVGLSRSAPESQNITCEVLPGNAAKEDGLVRSDSGSAYELKPLVSGQPAFAPQQLSFFEWFSNYYCCTLAEAIENALPAIAVRKRRPKKTKTPPSKEPPENKVVLNSSQNVAVTKISQAIDKRSYAPFLLYGVTGSGKTEVYIRLIQHCLESNLSALVIVPEIALTPQLLNEFESRLHHEIALLHSQLSPLQRWSTWESLRRGELMVAIGARSAVFAPLQNLGVIVVDEEHDSSYKQSDNLRYHGRDTAIVRARFESCPVVLGSATPSFETLLNVKRGRYQVLEMPERVSGRPLPTIEIVDLSRIKKKDMPSNNISPQLRDALSQTIEAGQQAVVLYNRRGFSSFLQCDTCGEAVRCPNCAVSLTYHKTSDRLVCHYCDFKTSSPQWCPECRNPRVTQMEDSALTDCPVGQLSHRGGGTQRLEEELLALFPQVTIARMDRDTVGAKDSYSTILNQMRSGQAQILLGTQMIAKGHDLPGVTLVGIVDADVGLHLPDFRSNERTFQLLTQASGRAGRGEQAGRVVIQTRQPNHPAIVAASTNRFKAFARYEMDYRRELLYPPYGRMLRLIVSSPHRQEAIDMAAHLMKTLQAYCNQILTSTNSEKDGKGENDQKRHVVFLGPGPAPIEKIKNRFRYHLIIKGSSSALLTRLGQIVGENRKAWSRKNELRISIDIDPVDML